MSWTHHAPSFRWLASETKRWNFGLSVYPPPLNKTGNLPPCHLTNLPSFLSYHLTTPPPPPPQTFPNCNLTTFSPLWLCHLILLPPFPPCHLTPLVHLSHLPSSLLSHLSQLTSLPTTNKSLKNSNVLSLGRQGKHVWLIVRKLLMKAGCWDALLTHRDLAEAISLSYSY